MHKELREQGELGANQTSQCKRYYAEHEGEGQARVLILRKEKLVVKLRLYGGNFIRAINAWAIGVARHSTGVLDRSDQEPRVLDVKTKKRLMIFGLSTLRGM